MDKQFKNRQIISWCKRLIRVSLFSLYAVIALDTNSSIAAPRARLENWRFYPQGSQLEISLSAPSNPQYFYLSQPSRIVVDLPDTKLGNNVPIKQNYNGAIQRIRVSQLNQDVTRIVMDLAPGAFFDQNRVQLQPVSWQNPTRWVFRPSIAGNGNFLPPGNSSSVNGLPPGNSSSVNGLPPGAYSPSQPPSNFPSAPQPPGVLLPPQSPGILPPQMYNPPQNIPGVNTLPSLTLPSSLPPLNTNNRNPQQPTVRVPPITITNPSPQIPNSVLPPARFPSPSGNFSTPPSIFPTPSSSFPTISTPNNSANPSNSRVIEFGQPFPNLNQ